MSQIKILRTRFTEHVKEGSEHCILLAIDHFLESSYMNLSFPCTIETRRQITNSTCITKETVLLQNHKILCFIHFVPSNCTN